MSQRRVLVAVTGGIAAYKIPELVRALVRSGCAVRCAMTANASQFVAPLALQTLSGEAVRTDLFDREQEGQIDHIALADWADLVIVWGSTQLDHKVSVLYTDTPSAQGGDKVTTLAPLRVHPGLLGQPVVANVDGSARGAPATGRVAAGVVAVPATLAGLDQAREDTWRAGRPPVLTFPTETLELPEGGALAPPVVDQLRLRLQTKRP